MSRLPIACQDGPPCFTVCGELAAALKMENSLASPTEIFKEGGMCNGMAKFCKSGVEPFAAQNWFDERFFTVGLSFENVSHFIGVPPDFNSAALMTASWQYITEFASICPDASGENGVTFGVSLVSNEKWSRFNEEVLYLNGSHLFCINSDGFDWATMVATVNAQRAQAAAPIIFDIVDGMVQLKPEMVIALNSGGGAIGSYQLGRTVVPSSGFNPKGEKPKPVLADYPFRFDDAFGLSEMIEIFVDSSSGLQRRDMQPGGDVYEIVMHEFTGASPYHVRATPRGAGPRWI